MADENPESNRGPLPGSAYSKYQSRDSSGTDTSFGSLYQTAANLDQIGPTLFREFNGSKETPVDPDYVVSQEDFKEFTKGIPSDRWDEAEDATSQEDLMQRRERILTTMEQEETLADAGWEGTAARLVANFTDPVAWGATAATEGALAPVIAAAKLGRTGRILYSAAAGAGENAAMESYLASQSSAHDMHDVLTATAFGAALGGGIGAFLPGASKAEGTQTFETMATQTGKRSQKAKTAQVREKAASDPDVVAAYQQKADDLDIADTRVSQAQAQRDDAADALEQARVRDESQSPAREVAEALEPSQRKSKTGVARRHADVGEYWRNAATKLANLDSTRMTEGQAGETAEVMRRLTPNSGKVSKEQATSIAQDAERRIDDVAKQRQARTDALQKNLDTAEKELTDATNARNTIKGEMDGLADRLPRDADGNKVSTKTAAEDSVNAARVEGTAVNESLTREDIEIPQELVEASEQPATASSIRASIYGQMSRSKSTVGRVMNRLLHADGVAGDAARGRATEFSAAEEADKLQLYAGTQVMKVYQPAYKRWAKDKNIGVFYRGREQYRQQFAREVSHYMRTSEALSEQAREAGDAARVQFDAMLEEAQRLGIEGFVDVENLGNYFPRIWEADQFVRWAEDDRVGASGLEQLVAKAVRQGSDDMPEGMPESIAGAIVKRFRRKGAGMDADFHRTLTGTDIDAVIKELSDTGMSRERLNQVEDFLADKQRSSEGGVHPHAKRRIQMDESASIHVDGHGELRLTDLMQSDAEKVTMQYIRTVGGQIAMARKMRQYGISDRSDGRINPERILDKMTDMAREEGLEESNIERLAVSRNMIAGRPPTEGFTSNAAQAMRIAKQLNFVRLMGQVGFAQIAELGPIVGQTGMTTVLSQMPRLRGMLKRARNGDLEDDLARELEEYEAVFGVERMLHQPRTREEDFGAEASSATRLGRALNSTELMLSKTSRAVADMSGMSAITIMTQRLAATSMSQRFLKMALKPSTANRKQMLSVGLDDEMLDRVLGQIRNHHASESGLLVGRKLKRMNFDQWDDLEARDALINAFHKWGNRMVQRNMIGELPALMHKEFGQLLTQFRSFVAGAYEKHTLHGVSQKNRIAFASMAWSSFFAGISYMAQTHLNAIGRDDERQYREERLSPLEIGKAAFQRAGYASLLPGLMDTAVTLPGFVDKPIFAYGRTTGLATNFLDGIPSVDLANNVGRAAGSLGALRSDYDYSRGDWESLWSLLAFQNALVLRNLGNSVADNLPEKSVQQPIGVSDYF